MHLVQTMAYTGERPWHGLGVRLAPHESIEVWAKQAGMDWRIEAADVQYVASSPSPDSLQIVPDQRVLYRSDTKNPLSVVSSRFKVVQPAEVLEFYRDLTEIGGYELETAGVLKGGRKLWALARTGHDVLLKGGDIVNGYVLLATACDGTLATTAQFTSIRVVCNNTLAIALADGEGVVKVPHRSDFNARAVKQQLGIAIRPWPDFEDRIKALADCRVSERTVERFLEKVFAQSEKETVSSTENPSHELSVSSLTYEQAMKKVRGLYAGAGRGANLLSAEGTAWGLLNGVTEYVDHHRRSRSDDHRRDAAWFGQGLQIKQRAWDEAMGLVA